MSDGSHSMRQFCQHQAVARVNVHYTAGPEQVGVVDGLHPHFVHLQVNEVPCQGLQKLITQLPMTML